MKWKPSITLIVFVASLLVWAKGSTLRAEYLPVYGGPTYTPGVGGYQTYYPANSVGLFVNDAGTAVANGRQIDAAGGTLGTQAIRWSPAGIELLGKLVGSSANFALAINDTGATVGWGFVGGTGVPIRWNANDGAATPMQTPPGGAGIANDINSAGAVVGIKVTSPTGAIRWDSAGNVAPLSGLPGYPHAEAYVINDAGTVLGRAFNGPGGERAVRWSAEGVITELGHLGLDANGMTTASPRAINATGTAIGFAFEFDEIGQYRNTLPVMWEASGTEAIELPRLDANPFSYSAVTAINDGGTIVGQAYKPPALPGDVWGTLAARWDNAGTTILPLGYLGSSLDGSTYARANAVNNTGLIVGSAAEFSVDGGFISDRAVFWNSSGMAIDLNTLIDPASGWLLTWAAAVSNTGWIAGAGQFEPDGPGGQDAYERWFLLQLPPGAPGDYNEDGIVDAADYTLWRDNLGSPTALPNDDTPGVGQDDYDRWKTHFGQTAGSGSQSSAVPEPSGCVLLVAASLAAFLRLPATAARWAKP